MGTLQAFNSAPQAQGIKASTINHALQLVGHILFLAAGVSFEDRQDLLGHKSVRVTTHYSAAELGNLIEAANRVCGENSRKSPALVVLRRKAVSGKTF